MEQEFRFHCVACHRCCRHQPGYVFLSEEDVVRLASYLNSSPDEFIARYTRSVYREGIRCYSLKEEKNFDCVFWKQGCSVYPARPLQCRAYPFWQRIIESSQAWQEEALSCPGIGQGEVYPPQQAQAIADQLARARPYTLAPTVTGACHTPATDPRAGKN